MIALLLDSSGIGGIETHVATLACALRKAGQDARIVFLAPHGDNPFHRQIEALNLPCTVLPGGIGALVSFLRRGVSLLHVHGYKAGLLGRIAARLTGVPVVTTYHAGERAPFPVGLYQHLDEWTGFLGGRIAVSEPIRRHLPYPARLVPNFIAVPPFVPRNIPERPRIGFVGRLSPEKAPERFIALAQALRNEADWHCFGDGPMRGRLEAAADDIVHFHGFQTDPNAIWPELDLLVIPSRAEGLPMAALEALARGVPIIATDCGALADVVGAGASKDQSDCRCGAAGWLVPAEADELAITGMIRAVKTWLALPADDRSALAAAAHGHVNAHFGAARALPEILASYRAAGWRAAP